MANADRTKDAMEMAAASPDPAVRQLALSYKAMRQQLEALDGFFAIYNGGVVQPLGGAAPAATNGSGGPAPVVHKPAAGAPKSTVTKSLCDILAEKGPLDMDALHGEYVRRNPDDAGRTREQVRLGTARHPDRFRRVSDTDRRVCLVEFAPPAAPVEAGRADVA
jgi:hypothetical protein